MGELFLLAATVFTAYYVTRRSLTVYLEGCELG